MLKELIENQNPIHTRNISLSTFPHGKDRVIVHGELKDKRHISIIDVIGRAKNPGTIHHMSATLLIAPDPLRIIQAEAEMITVPMDQCPQTLDCMEQIAGLEIKPGFSRQVSKIMGGPLGCAHLTTLIKAMGQEIVHGWLTRKRSEKQHQTIPLEDLKEKSYLIDSCRLWKKDGPKYQELRLALTGE